jgi:hypothetical protein
VSYRSGNNWIAIGLVQAGDKLIYQLWYQVNIRPFIDGGTCGTVPYVYGARSPHSWTVL